MRRGAASSPAWVRVGDIEIDLVARRVTVGDRPVALSPVDLSLLYVLATRRGQVVGRETIDRLVWGKQQRSNVIERHVASLRGKICPDPGNPYYIQTVTGQGYRFR